MEDDASLQKALQRLLEGVGYRLDLFGSAEQLLAFCRRHPGLAGQEQLCLVMDHRLPGRSGVEVQQEVHDLLGAPPVIFISGEVDTHSLNQAWRQGAKEFLLKPFQPDDLLAALDKVFAAAVSNPDPQTQARLRLLTRRERQVLDCVVRGQTNQQTSEELHICLRTVKMHRSRLMQKLGLNNLPDLVRFYERSRS
ncbi:MAG: response regulator [Gammaproteobacteria bacterium]|nr:response regulator [Gammaproteobacteria bacterium]